MHIEGFKNAQKRKQVCEAHIAGFKERAKAETGLRGAHSRVQINEKFTEN
ncbi:hypothetical protein AM1BK_23160 [Neobacillus kokaensis]|uniref:Uncharacterized protein n=1 Tax=Neobacillus kokaensis TaxID=2759023 RepID=A0ABQ3N456_9BACI|nr:hypothetical protein AM1BK_23160 [Neobacillus kokaensis]